MKETSDPTSVCLFLIELDKFEPAVKMNQSLWPEIAARLQAELAPTSWLHFDGKHRLYCITLSMVMDVAAEYGKDLCAIFDDPIHLNNGSDISVSLKVGGIFIPSKSSANAQEILDHSEDILQRTKRLGRHYFRLAQANG